MVVTLAVPSAAPQLAAVPATVAVIALGWVIVTVWVFWQPLASVTVKV